MKKRQSQYLKRVPIENHNRGISLKLLSDTIEPIRHDYYQIIKGYIGGDAPKDFIGLYEYDGVVKRRSRRTWVRYIAKVGHKWYPFESIIEHLLNRTGEVLGLNMAASQLRMAHGQLRFLSRYFLKPEDGQSMMHGAQIYSAYLGDRDDIGFVEEVENRRLSREWFTFQFTEEAVKFLFPHHYQKIMERFVELLLFDAIVGNNDRHFYNWAVITNNITNNFDPVFSPIYDTARGLFWNESEAKLIENFCYQKGEKKGLINEQKLEKYIKNSRPKTGWEGWKGKKHENHFELLKLIYHNYPKYRTICNKLLEDVHLDRMKTLIDEEFKLYFSEIRYKLTLRCLEVRFSKLQKLCIK